MKITGQNTPIQLNAYLKQVRQQQQNNVYQQQAKGTGGDKVQLSDRAREIQQAASDFKAMPDVREEKVQQVKMDIDTGTYRVSGPKAARGLLRESFENDLILRKINVRA